MPDPETLDRYARAVHDARLSVNAERERPFSVLEWEDRTEEQKELDRRAASSVAAMAVHDADAEALELRKRLVLVGAHLPAILDALTARIADERWESQKARFRDAKAALETLKGGEVPRQ
jgi:hypothetical protein